MSTTPPLPDSSDSIPSPLQELDHSPKHGYEMWSPMHQSAPKDPTFIDISPRSAGFPLPPALDFGKSPVHRDSRLRVSSSDGIGISVLGSPMVEEPISPNTPPTSPAMGKLSLSTPPLTPLEGTSISPSTRVLEPFNLHRTPTNVSLKQPPSSSADIQGTPQASAIMSGPSGVNDDI